MGSCSFSLSTWEADGRQISLVQGQPGLQSKSQISRGYTVVGSCSAPLLGCGTHGQGGKMQGVLDCLSLPVSPPSSTGL